MGDTAAQIAAAVQQGRTTARQAVEQALYRIEATDARIGAYQLIRSSAALLEADAVDRRADRAQLPLAGVPVAIKDNVAVAGEPMRQGSTATDPTPQPLDHEVVRRLRAAGAVIVGCTRMPELDLFSTSDSGFGITRNPWDSAQAAGGAFGAAAAVAAGTVPIALGNDGLGSLRIAAACCGLVGLKPGAGIVAAELGGKSWFGMAENGPLATTVDDVALTLAVLADRPGLARPTSPGLLRIGVSTAAPTPFAPVDDSWADAAASTGRLLREAGHTVVRTDPPYGHRLAYKEFVRWTASAAVDVRAVRDRTALAARTRRHAAIGELVLRIGSPRPNGRRRWQKRVESYFADLDMLITPALARSPLPARASRGWLADIGSSARFAPFTAPWNVAGWPAMTVPAGLDGRGQPTAVQLVAKPGAESQLIHVARELEQLRPWPRLAPGYH